jgi:hypothetical protein
VRVDEITPFGGNGIDPSWGHIVKITLSKRNLLALLQKLEMPGSKRTIYILDNGVALGVTAESDEVHYADREPAGAMHPETEEAIK